MKISTLIPILILSFAAFVTTLAAQDTPSATLSAEDVKQVRKIIADRDFYKASYENEKQLRDAAEKSIIGWRSLYLAEKDRADRVQGGRVEELQKAVEASRDLHALDSQKLAENEFTIRKLKVQRKWWFAAGLGTGAAAAAYGASKLSF